MAKLTTFGKVALLALSLPVSACKYLPREDDPILPPRLAAAPDPGPSSQRLDKNGYPLIGAYPTAATTQVSNEEVAATRARYSGVASRGAGSTAATYQRNVADLQAVAAAQQQAPAAQGAEAASSRAQ